MFSKVQIPSLDVTLQWVLDSTIKKRKVNLEAGTHFGLERLKVPGVRVNLNTKVCDIEERNFKLVIVEGEKRMKIVFQLFFNFVLFSLEQKKKQAKRRGKMAIPTFRIWGRSKLLFTNVFMFVLFKN